MKRRRAMKVAAGLFAGSGIGLITLSHAFKPKKPPVQEPYKLDYNQTETGWKYVRLIPEIIAELAYTYYNEGSCMYATIKSVVSQLAEKTGEPYTSFPFQMFKYGHGGVGGYGSICGALNGAAALIGLLIPDKNVQDKMIADIFRWYENEPLPEFIPKSPSYDFLPVKSISNSVLCHTSNTNWCKSAELKVDSKERKERCRRLTADVAQKVTLALNHIIVNKYITNNQNDEAVSSCMVCHGSEGKVNNTAVKMSCNSCHSESPGHRVFSDIHYKLMK